MKSKIVRLAVACAVVLASSFAWAAPASAADDAQGCTEYGCSQWWGTGYGYWQADGDIMRVCDSYADGWSVVVIATFGKTTKYKWHTAGYSWPVKCTDRSYGNLPEDSVFYYQACLGKYSDNLINGDSCGPITYAIA
jgi:hypothetical protein